MNLARTGTDYTFNEVCWIIHSYYTGLNIKDIASYLLRSEDEINLLFSNYKKSSGLGLDKQNVLIELNSLYLDRKLKLNAK